MLDVYYSEDQFLQSCDVCGRPTIISLEMAGERVGCRHCGGTFVASDHSLVYRKCVETTFEASNAARRLRAGSNVLRMAASVLTAISNLFGELI